MWIDCYSQPHKITQFQILCITSEHPFKLSAQNRKTRSSSFCREIFVATGWIPSFLLASKGIHCHHTVNYRAARYSLASCESNIQIATVDRRKLCIPPPQDVYSTHIQHILYILSNKCQLPNDKSLNASSKNLPRNSMTLRIQLLAL
jgi:hypothetical protein